MDYSVTHRVYYFLKRPDVTSSEEMLESHPGAEMKQIKVKNLSRHPAQSRITTACEGTARPPSLTPPRAARSTLTSSETQHSSDEQTAARKRATHPRRLVNREQMLSRCPIALVTVRDREVSRKQRAEPALERLAWTETEWQVSKRIQVTRLTLPCKPVLQQWQRAKRANATKFKSQ